MKKPLDDTHHRATGDGNAETPTTKEDEYYNLIGELAVVGFVHDELLEVEQKLRRAGIEDLAIATANRAAKIQSKLEHLQTLEQQFPKPTQAPGVKAEESSYGSSKAQQRPTRNVKPPQTQEARRQTNTQLLDSLHGRWELTASQNGLSDEPESSRFDSYSWSFDPPRTVTTDWKRDGRTGGGANHFSIDTSSDPHQLTIYGENMLIQAIFEIDGDRLKVAYFGISQTARPESFDDQRTDAGPLVIQTFERSVDGQSF